jgi:exoribonuclease-2
VRYALFDDAGKFHAGRVMSEADASLQVELASGKRVKVKAANVLLRFDAPEPAGLIDGAQALAREIDLDLAWEFAPEGEFGFIDLARDYFSADAGPTQQAAALFRLFDAPHYFRRVGKGRFRKAPEDIVRAALLAIERKAQLAAQVDAWASELVAGRCPAPIAEQLLRILFKPDRNGPEYKAVVEAARRAQRPPLELLKAAGAIASPYQFHWQRFLADQFPRGTGFAPQALPPAPADLPLAEAAAFSIDDSATTEIDDALSVQGLGSGCVTLGIHIAAPGLAVLPDSALDKVARERLSTVYLPGWKITMLPDDVVQAYTLTEGRDCPAVSLYARFDEASLALLGAQTRIERVRIVANLRHDRLDGVITEAALADPAAAGFAFASELAFAWRLARHLKAGRERVRGRPEAFNRPDYQFRLVRPDGTAPTAPPDGSETVQISERARGAPLDLIVSETMILANCHWGGLLADSGVPGVYRSQAALAPGVKVRMGAKPAPHAGLGVPQYVWATSPLRRYVDLVNQWQIIAAARHGRAAALAAPFKPRDATLFSVITAFDAAYAAYHEFQHAIERFWSLRWLQQNGVTELSATLLKDGLARADTLPLVFRVPGCDGLPRGTHVRVRIAGIDLLTLELHTVLAARLEEAVQPPPEETADEEAIEEAVEEAAPLALAIDLGDAAEPAAGAGAEAATSGADPAPAAP